MDDKSPTPTKLVVLTDESGRIRAAMVRSVHAGVGSPPEISIVPDERDLLHEIDLSDDEARSITALDQYFVSGQGVDARLVRRDSQTQP